MVTMTASRPAACFLFGDLQRGGDGGGGGDADQQALVAAQPLGHGVGALGRHVDVLGRRGRGRRWAARWRSPCASGLRGR